MTTRTRLGPAAARGRAVPPNEPQHRSRWAAALIVVLAAAALVTVGVVVLVRASPASAPFSWLWPVPAPTTWHRLTSSSGAVLSYPPSFAAAPGDPGTVSAALGRGPRYIGYLNSTPQQGDERLSGFANFRVHLLGEDDARKVREEASTTNVAFRGGRGSCVIDDYFTRVGDHHYREIACFVQGARGGNVVVAAALDPDFARLQPVLRRAVTSFAVP